MISDLRMGTGERKLSSDVSSCHFAWGAVRTSECYELKVVKIVVACQE